MSVHNDVCGIMILYEEGDCVVLTTSESRICTVSYEPKLARSVYRLSFTCYGKDSPLACHWSVVKRRLT